MLLSGIWKKCEVLLENSAVDWSIRQLGSVNLLLGVSGDEGVTSHENLLHFCPNFIPRVNRLHDKVAEQWIELGNVPVEQVWCKVAKSLQAENNDPYQRLRFLRVDKLSQVRFLFFVLVQLENTGLV